MPVVTMDRARADLDQVEGRLAECIREAWSAFQAILTEIHPGMRVRARRTLMQDIAVAKIEEEFGGTPGFRILESNTGRVLLIVTNRLLLQFRMLDREFRTKDNDTQAARDFDAQREAEELPHLPRITIGWRLNQLETGVEGIYVTFTLGDLVWLYRLSEHGEDEYGAETLEFPPSARQSGETKRRVGPKRVPADADEEVIPLQPKVVS